MVREMYTTMKEFEEAKDYWISTLRNVKSGLNLVPDHFIDGEFAANYEKKYFTRESSDALLHMSNGNDLSLFIILLTVLKILLCKLSRQRDIVVASPVRGNLNSDLNRFVLFRDDVRSVQSFRELLMQVKDSVISGYRNQHYPIANILDLLNLPDGSCLFRIVAVLEQLHEWRWVHAALEQHRSDFVFCFKGNDGRLLIQLLYNSKKFKRRTAYSIFSMFQVVLQQVIEDRDILVKDIQIIPLEEKRKVLFDFNKTKHRDSKPRLVQELFQDQVIVRSDEIAVVFLDQTLTYRQLNKLVNLMAWDLKDHGVGPDTMVVLLMNSSIETVVGILAVIKAGGAYVPLEPDLPLVRKRLILKDCAPRLIISDKANYPQATFLSGEMGCDVLLARNRYEAFARIGDLEVVNHLSDILYVVYTSGTTGAPKGVAVEHGGLVNYICWRLDSPYFPRRNVTLQLLSYAFDGFGSNFFTALFSGGTLVMIPQEKRLDARFIDQVIAAERVTHSSLVPGMYQMVLRAAMHGELDSLKVVVLAGEKCGESLIRESKSKLPRVILINEYGPTETTVTASAKFNIRATCTSMIGRPIANCMIYILDSDHNPVAVGVQGEIFIGGPGVARGYLNQPELTADKFIRSPFASDETLYQSGDLGRWNASGEIEILGRIDEQLKIRGNRIEPEEIEAIVMLHPDIVDVAVTAIAEGDGGGSICVYAVTDRPLEDLSLRDFLMGRLPPYMIPSHYMKIEQLPRTPGGKVDRRALPLPGGAGPAGEIERVFGRIHLVYDI